MTTDTLVIMLNLCVVGLAICTIILSVLIRSISKKLQAVELAIFCNPMLYECWRGFYDGLKDKYEPTEVIKD